jgi:dolichol-phosphate mannosyltransferase
MVEISVVAPIYNESNNVSEFVNRVRNSLNCLGVSFRIILVDDGSSDNSWEIIEKEYLKSDDVIGLKLSKNFGHHHAITAGLFQTESEWVIVMDSDLQDQPEYILNLYKKAQEGYEVVFVSRMERPESRWYLFIQKFFYFSLNKLSGVNFDSTQANFSIIHKKVVEAFRKFPEQARFYPSTINWLGFSRSEIKAVHGMRFSGAPSYTLKKRIKLALDIILAFSDRPLKIAISLGSISSIFSFIFFGVIIARNILYGFSVTGWASLMATQLFIGGVVLITLGINGIYTGRVYSEVKSRPLFIVQEKLER